MRNTPFGGFLIQEQSTVAYLFLFVECWFIKSEFHLMSVKEQHTKLFPMFTLSPCCGSGTHVAGDHGTATYMHLTV